MNISGKFTCEISVEAPTFQTAMVSGEMEVVGKYEKQNTKIIKRVKYSYNGGACQKQIN